MTGTAITCSDNACDEKSFIKFPVTKGTSYIIQLGSPDIGGLIRDPILLVIDEVTSGGAGDLGDSYCGPANVNSSGFTADLRVMGSLKVSDNNLNLWRVSCS